MVPVLLHILRVEMAATSTVYQPTRPFNPGSNAGHAYHVAATQLCKVM
jgi:hypothetical protein